MRSDDEKRILGLWPKYEDGGYVMPGDVAVANNGAKKGRAFTVLSVRVNTVGVCLTDCDGSYWNYKAGDRRVKRPEPKVLDADGVEVHLGDTVYESNGQSGIVIAVHPSTRCVDLRQEGCVACAMDAKRLTHTRPDSWERLEEDAKKGNCEYRGRSQSSCDGCYLNGKSGCDEYVRIDLVRRAKKLAEKEASR